MNHFKKYITGYMVALFFLMVIPAGFVVPDWAVFFVVFPCAWIVAQIEKRVMRL